MVDVGTSITIRVPASTSNLGAGFDVLGLALGMHLTASLEVTASGLDVQIDGDGADRLPRDASNLIVRMMLEEAGHPKMGIRLRTHSNIPLTRGFGSSGTAAIAGVALGHFLKHGELPDRQAVLRRTTAFEGHPDNVSASIFGGLTVSAQIDNDVVCRTLRLPESTKIVAVVPECELSTEAARAALPVAYSRGDVVFNLQRLAILMTGLMSGDSELLSHGVDDRLHQPYRFGLLPSMRDVADAMSSTEGCRGAFISGAGPTIAAFATGNGDAIGGAGVRAFADAGIGAEYRLLEPDYAGLVRIDG